MSRFQTLGSVVVSTAEVLHNMNITDYCMFCAIRVISSHMPYRGIWHMIDLYTTDNCNFNSLASRATEENYSDSLFAVHNSFPSDINKIQIAYILVGIEDRHVYPFICQHEGYIYFWNPNDSLSKQNNLQWICRRIPV